MIDPAVSLPPGARVSLPHELVSQVVATLAELPARVSMELILAIRSEAEVVPPPAEPALAGSDAAADT